MLCSVAEKLLACCTSCGLSSTSGVLAQRSRRALWQCNTKGVCRNVLYSGQGTWCVQADEAKKTMTLMWNVTEANLAKNATSEIFAPADLFFQVLQDPRAFVISVDMQAPWTCKPCGHANHVDMQTTWTCKPRGHASPVDMQTPWTCRPRGHANHVDIEMYTAWFAHETRPRVHTMAKRGVVFRSVHTGQCSEHDP